MTGIQTNEAVEFFFQKCDAALSSDLAKLDVGAVPPGIFRYTVQEEWAAFKDDPGNR